MTYRIDRTNRVLLALLGTTLLVAGGLVLARSLGLLGSMSAAEPVLPAEVVAPVADSPWFWAAVAAIALVIALLSLWWLVAQTSRDRLRHLEVDPTRSGGETVLRAASIADAVEQEVESYPGVDRCTMQLIGKAGRHRHRLVVSLTDRADIDSVRSQLTARTIPNIRRALDFDDPEMDIELVLAPRRRRQLQ